MCTRALSSLIPLRRGGSLTSSSTSSIATTITRAPTDVYYEQVPFTEFITRVFELCRTLWPNACHDATEVDRMIGGINHRFFGLSIVHCQGAERTQYILRVPRSGEEPVDRSDEEDMDRSVAYLKFVKENSQIPVPDVVTFDRTADNPLQKQYIIQRRVPGEDSQFSYLTLDHEGKCNIARELGGIYRQIQQMRSDNPGILAPRQDEHGSSSFSMIEAWDGFDKLAPTKRRDELPVQSCSETLIGIYERQRANATRTDNFEMIDFMNESIKITKEMKALGYLDDSQISLCHRGLWPSNIMIDSTMRPTISAVLGWDDAVFAPRFMSCEPPLWIWAWNHEKRTDVVRGQETHVDEDQRLAGEIPATAELCELKRVFDEAAGPEYAHYAYGPQYRIARALFQYAIQDVYFDEDDDEMHKVIEEWTEMRREAERKRKGGFRSRTIKHFFDTANLFARPLPSLSRRYSPKPSDSP